MPPKGEAQSLTHDLLRRAHSPDSASRIYADKIQHRPLLLKPSSPPPSTARDARRRARDERKKRARALKPKPLSARERRRLQLYRIPEEGRKYAVFAPLNRLWLGYVREVLGGDLYGGGGGSQGAAAAAAAAKLSAADFHGAEVEVSRSRCPSRVGVRGIVVKDSRFAFEVVTRRDQVKTLPKEGTIFRVHVPAPDAAPDQKPFCLEIHGDQFQHRASDRANKKFKNHFLKEL
ncbi:putative ribonuclease P protein subunit p29 [Rosellinia necatrix]|uniref:Ribonuclease P protein subunit n=1 Tax=Rosellinia necatrix TaxID=77044 RepID=A0A1W2TTK5_ROSNE|nr:putative ribonuclease P protein subunit p29 [Rosellinia necatrix]